MAQHWLIALLVLVFLNQSLAVVAMPCQSMAETPNAHEAMDHAAMGMHHDMSQMAQSDKSSDLAQAHDCCKTMGHCSSSSCSLPALSYNLPVNVLFETSLIADLYRDQMPKTPVSSFYRPPIFR
jgi:hypothetical protein